MTELIKLNEYPVLNVLKKLLQDKSTKENIILATDAYEELGTEYSANSKITTDAICRFAVCDIQPRVYKSRGEQNKRTRKSAEVFTPSLTIFML